MSKKKNQHVGATAAPQGAQNVVTSYDASSLLLSGSKKGAQKASTAAPAESGASRKGVAVSKPKAKGLNFVPMMTYALGFVFLAVFCCWTYGSVFHHIGLDNFVCSDAEAMTFVRRLSCGSLYWAARYVLLVFKNQWIGGLLMAALLTLTAWLFDRCVLCLTAKNEKLGGLGYGVGFLPVFGLLSYMVYRGYNLYFRCEISTFVVWTLTLFAGALVLGVAGMLIKRFTVKNAVKLTRWSLAGLLLSLVAYCGLTYQAIVPGENVRVSCSMQNILDETQDWEAMGDLARSCKQPSRSVAALYAISLVESNQLLERVFDIPYNYPDIELDNLGGNDEGVNYIADCNLYAGLPNAAYHSSMETHVMFGPRMRNYKRMAICSIINGEYALAQRYLNLISKVPFEKSWVEKYEAMIESPEFIDSDEVMANIKALAPRETLFEQNYRQPVFLGYNVGVVNGSNTTLITSVASCMYSKDLNNLLLRTDFLQNMTTLPLSVQQCIFVASVNRPGLIDKYPQIKSVQGLLQQDFRAFIADATPFLEKKKASKGDEEATKAIQHEMAEALHDKWLGSYYYYYYCGNLNQTVSKTESHGVN